MKFVIGALFTVGMLAASDWSASGEVLHEFKPVVTYRAKLDGSLLVIEAALQPGWHTFAIDNEKRAAAKLAGKPSLGIDQPTQITVENGLRVAGPWYQLEPVDFSKPELRWYTFGYEKQAIFAAKVRRAGGGPAKIGIRGQACMESICKNIDVSLSLSLAGPSKAASTFDLKKLVKVQ